MRRPLTRRSTRMAVFSASAALLAGAAVWGTMTPSAHAESGYRVCLYGEINDGSVSGSGSGSGSGSFIQKWKHFYVGKISKYFECPVLDPRKFSTGLLPQPVPVMTCEDLQKRLIDEGGTRIVEGTGDDEEKKHPLTESSGDPCPYMMNDALNSVVINQEEASNSLKFLKKGDVQVFADPGVLLDQLT